MYPVFLTLEGKPCLVVGGGEVAFRKTETLLKSGAAQVKVVAPLLHPGFARLGAKGRIRFFKRKFRLSDLKGAAIVVCSTDSEEVNALVGKAAEKSGALVNVVDRPALCNFIVPAVFRNGPLTIAVSTGGASPALAKKIRIRLGRTYGGAFGGKVEALRKLRVKMLAEKTAPGKLAAKRAYFRLLRRI
ncbi:MAG: bifunctional precorrin-2 dehydrogenase/sirohydrochlorin ferrochelatase [Elusimicrobia bacterium]|nr:bifunctional precorrin-2 dehydrogenase/sirohydrochlorin ferrochelatase [Elusimicrobiota bacterium]